MKFVIIGAGLIGVATAYYLNRRGHEVTVIDREEGPGRETSFANGALLTASMAEPWNTPGCWRVLLLSLARSDAPLQLRFHALPSLTAWGLTFLRNSNPQRFQRNAQSNLRLALHSLEAMQSLRQEIAIDYGRGTQGSLKIFRDLAGLERASNDARALLSEGLTSRTLTASQTIALEPGLAPIEGQLTGALHYEADEAGDAYRFCLGLADQLRSRGVEFHFRTSVSLEMRSGKVAALIGGTQRFVAERYVVATGSYSASMLQPVGIKIPVQPAKGYSVTLDEPVGQRSLGIPIIDDAYHAAGVPLNGAIRVAGTAEFSGFDRTIQPERVRSLLALLKQVLPQAPLDPAQARPWCGLRALSADGVPIIGHTPISNLFVNTGHGHLGWTMSAGSGQLLAQILCGESTSIDAAPFALSRF